MKSLSNFKLMGRSTDKGSVFDNSRHYSIKVFVKGYQFRQKGEKMIQISHIPYRANGYNFYIHSPEQAYKLADHIIMAASELEELRSRK